MKKILTGAFIVLSFAGYSQKQDSVKSEAWENIYRASATKINDLVNTKLDVSFDYTKSRMYRKSLDHSSSSFLPYRFFTSRCKIHEY